MSRRSRPNALLALAIAGACAFGAPSAASAAPAPGSAVPGELIVGFEPGTTGATREAARDDADVAVKRSLPVPGVQVVKTDAGQSVADARTELESAPGVRYAEPNRYRQAAATPNDPYYRYLWGASNQGQRIAGSSGTAGADIRAPEAWDIATGNPASPVAVLDSGIEFGHPDLGSQIWANPGESGSGREGNGVDDDGNGYVDDWHGWDFIGRDNTATDENGHGTHVSGTIAASGNNGSGITGVSWNSRVLPLRVLDANGSGTVADLITAYRYAAAKGVRVVNVSITGSGYSAAERDAIESAPNTLFVVAAGNGGSDGVGDNNDAAGQYPCAYPSPNVVCVAASDQNDGRANFSNYGPGSVDLAAPGVKILSTVSGAYSYMDGTSMATPHVSGVASLMSGLRTDLRPADIRADLIAGAARRSAFQGVTVSGGRLDAAQSLRLAVDHPRLQPTPAAPAPVAPPRAVAKKPAAVKVSLKLLSKRQLRILLKKGLRLRAGCTVSCKLTVRISMDTRTARRLDVARASRTVGIGRITVTGSDKSVTVRLSAKGKRLLARAKNARLVVEATTGDPAGGTKRRAVTASFKR